jgi:hypothetical protein
MIKTKACKGVGQEGSSRRQGLVRVRAKREVRKSHLMLLGVQESVKE